MFRKTVLEYGVSYDRFRDDFIHSHTYHAVRNPAIRNDHMVNLGRITALLMDREDLVRKYYSGEWKSRARVTPCAKVALTPDNFF